MKSILNIFILIILIKSSLSYNAQNENSTQFNSTSRKARDASNHPSVEPMHEEEIVLASWRWHELQKFIIVPVFVLIAAGAKILYHHSNTLHTHVPESCVLIILGTLVGTTVHLFKIQASEYIPKFSPELFFYLLLPPIILESAYSLHDRQFFRNIGTILLFAVVGTLLNITLIGPSLYFCGYFGLYNKIPFLECLTFSTLICAVDPVAVLAIFQELGINKGFYFLVFGESLFNDAVVITLYNMVTALASATKIQAMDMVIGTVSLLTVSFGGLFIGVSLGVLTCIITRFTEDVRVIEPLIAILLAYLSYVFSELFHFSGIISLIGCGLMQAEYTRHNISKKSYTTIKYLTKTISSIADVIIFLFLGMVLVRDNHQWDTYFVIFTTLFCVVCRFISVFLLSYVANNFFKRVRNISFEEQLLMAYGGLRGAIAFCLAIMMDSKHITSADKFITTTLFIILFTVFILGSTTKPVVRLLRVQIQVKHEAKLFIEINNKAVETVMAGFEEIAGQRSVNYWTRKLNRFNDNYLKKFLVRGGAEATGAIRTRYEKMYATKGKTKIHKKGKVEDNNMMEKKNDLIIDNIDIENDLNELQNVKIDTGRKMSRISIISFTEKKPYNTGEENKLNSNKIFSINMGEHKEKKGDEKKEETRKSSAKRRESKWDILKPHVKSGMWSSTESREGVVETKSRGDSGKSHHHHHHHDNDDVRSALVSAFSKSAYYQLPGSIHHIEDKERKIIKSSKWMSAKSKLSLATSASVKVNQMRNSRNDLDNDDEKGDTPEKVDDGNEMKNNMRHEKFSRYSNIVKTKETPNNNSNLKKSRSEENLSPIKKRF